MKNKVGAASVTHDFLIVIDAETIIDLYGAPSTDSNNPTFINNPDKVVFMLMKIGHVLAGQGGSLTFNASLSHMLRWRETTLTRNTGYNVQLYNLTVHSGKSLLSSPSISSFSFTLPIPYVTDPLHPSEYQEIADCSWLADICAMGEAVYNLYFVIRTRDGNAIGYFYCNFPIKIFS